MTFFISIFLTFTAFADFGFFTEVDGFDNQTVKSKIFKIYTPAGQYSSLPLENKPVLLDGAQNLLASGEIDSVQYDALLFQVEYCELKQMDPCLLFFDVIRGTAFTAGEEGTIWTAFHNISGAAINAIGQLMQQNAAKDLQAVKQYMKQGKFPVYLIDEHGNTVVAPQLDESNWAQNMGFPFDNIGKFYKGEEPSAENDFAQFEVPGLSIEPLPVAGDFSFGEAVIIGGYPASTGVKKARFGGLDSDGQSFYFGKGEILDLDSFLERQNFQGELSEEQQFKRTRQLMATTDGFSGHSGSPFLNQNGEVLGVFVEYLPVWMPTPATNTSYGPNSSYIYEVLESL